MTPKKPVGGIGFITAAVVIGFAAFAIGLAVFWDNIIAAANQ